jgi:hypothetical protein
MQKSNRIAFLLCISIALVATGACKKNGVGGTAEIHALIYHGTTALVGTTTLYVKFDATTEPSNPTTNYDLKVQGEPDDNHVHVENLRPGDYYLYAVSFDSLAMVAVKGGTAATIKWSERKKTKEVDVQTSN